MTNHYLCRMRIFRLLGIIILVSWLACSCTTTQNMSKYNFAKLYKGSELIIKPKFTIFHETEGNSEVHFQILSNGLLYNKPENLKDYTANLKFMYLLYESFTSTTIIDSASFVISDVNNEKVNKSITGMFNIKAQYPKRYILRVIVKDLNRDIEEEQLIQIDKTSRQNRQNYFTENLKTQQPMLGYQINNNGSVRITHNDKMIKRIIVKYYDREFPLSPPPFISYSAKRFDFEPDSFYYVTLDENSSFETNFMLEGLYHIQSDSTATEGLTIMRVDKYFPAIKKHEDMLPSLRFISTNKEYKAISEAIDSQDAVDEFWLDRTSSPDKSRGLIRNYYSRIEDSNEFFTSHVPGWKSDRGLVYVVFGPPDNIYRSVSGESWIYGNNKSQPNLTFNFTKTFNPFSDNDFRLKRSPEYKSFWYNAVDTWRQGRVYNY